MAVIDKEVPAGTGIVPLTIEQYHRMLETGILTEGAPIELVVSRKGARLFARAEPLFPVDMPIHPSGPLTFFSRISAETLQFETDGDGRVTGLTGTSPEGVPSNGPELIICPPYGIARSSGFVTSISGWSYTGMISRPYCVANSKSRWSCAGTAITAPVPYVTRT